MIGFNSQNDEWDSFGISLRRNIWCTVGNELFNSFLIAEEKHHTIYRCYLFLLLNFNQSQIIVSSFTHDHIVTLYFLLFFIFDKPKKLKLLPVIQTLILIKDFWIFKKKRFLQFLFLNFEYSKPSPLRHIWWHWVYCIKLSRPSYVSLQLAYCTYKTSIIQNDSPAAVPKDYLTFFGYVIQSYKSNFIL